MERQNQKVPSSIYRTLIAGVLLGATLMLAPLAGWAQSDGGVREDAGQAVSFRVEPAIADLRKQGRGKGLWLMGAGLKPGQDVAVYVTMLGAESDISFMLSPRPRANAEGVMITSWEIRAKRFSRIFGDQLTFQLRDPETLKLLATSPVAVCREGKDKAAPWCNAAQALLPIHKEKKKKKKKKKKKSKK